VSSEAIVFKLGWTLIHSVWQGTAAALFLAIALRGLRNSSARLRYAAACIAMLWLVIQPLATFCLIPAPATPLAESFAARGVGAAALETVKVLPALPSGTWNYPLPAQRERILPFVVALWGLGVGLMLLLRGAGWASVRRWKRTGAVALEQFWQARIEQLRLRLRVRRRIPAFASLVVDTPVVAGWLKPVILVPASALTGMDPAYLEALLLHELAHIRRYDHWVNMLQTQVEMLGFYHPAVWWISSVMRIERENCCDDLVVGALPDRRVYLRALVQLEEMRGALPSFGVAAAGGSLLNRVRRLTGHQAPHRPNATGLSAAALAVAISLAGPLSVVSSRASAPANWEPLFDGRSLAGWEQLGGPGRFYVERGEIVGSSAPSATAAFLCTRSQYSDFILEFDVQIDPELNAGVQFRSRQGRRGETGKVVGYQVEIDGEHAGTSGSIWDEARRNRWLWAGAPDVRSRSAFLENGAWNHYRLVCLRSSIRSWVNGVPCANLTDSLSDRGFIGLQVYNRQGHRPLAVRWRNIRLERI
jgi:beta-lactamase regulating signal transducer with metallopeptidase domain